MKRINFIGLAFSLSILLYPHHASSALLQYQSGEMSMFLNLNLRQTDIYHLQGESTVYPTATSSVYSIGYGNMSGLNTSRIEFNYQLFSEGSSDGYGAISSGSAIGSSTDSFGNPIGTPYTFMIAPSSPAEHIGDPVQISFSILTSGYLYVNHTAVVSQDVSFNSRGGIQTSTESAYFSHAFGVPSNATHLYEQYGNNDAFTLNSRIGDTISLLYDGWMMNLVADVPGQKSYNQLN